MSVLNALESFLWRYIRGAVRSLTGLTGPSFEQAHRVSPTAPASAAISTLASFTSACTSRCAHVLPLACDNGVTPAQPDCSKAFASAREVIEKIVKGELAIDQLTLESSIASLAYTFASQEATVGSAANSSFSNQVLYGVSRDYAQEMLAKVQVRSLPLPSFGSLTISRSTSRSSKSSSQSAPISCPLSTRRRPLPLSRPARASRTRSRRRWQALGTRLRSRSLLAAMRTSLVRRMRAGKRWKVRARTRRCKQLAISFAKPSVHSRISLANKGPRSFSGLGDDLPTARSRQPSSHRLAIR